MKNIFQLSIILACLLPLYAEPQLDELHTTENVPINFYGKVVDQNGQPLAHAKIKLELHLGYMTSPTEGAMKIDNIGLESDERGDWTVTNLKGHSLQVVSITKEGYDMSHLTLKFFGYSATAEPFHPDPKHPVLFVLWAKAQKTPLITREKNYDFIPDGRAYAINLRTRKITEATNSEGDLQFRLKRPSGVGRRDKFDWAFSLDALHGNVFVPVDEDYYEMTFPPASGYTTQFQTDRQIADQSWRGGGGKEFYIKMHDGRSYAKMELVWEPIAVNAGPKTNEAGIHIKYTLNPSGSALTQ